MNPYSPPATDTEDRAVAPITPARRAAVEKELKRLNSLIFVACVPGLVLQGLGQDGQYPLLWPVGWFLFAVGVAFYARSRGRSLVWGLLGALSCIGMLILAFLPKGCLNCASRSSYKAKSCERCTGPLGA